MVPHERRSRPSPDDWVHLPRDAGNVNGGSGSEKFVGLVWLRVLFAACGLFTGVFCSVTALTVRRGDASSATYYGGAVVLIVLGVLSALASFAIACERVVVDDDGVHRDNPLWFTRTTSWDEVNDVSVETDFNTHPVIETVGGRKIRLRGAASLWLSPRSSTAQAAEAIRSRLDGR